MKTVLRSLIITTALLAGSVFADTHAEIGHLLNFVANTSCEYHRNGAVYDGPEARDHINRKYEHYKKKVRTAEDFIKYSATKSMISGRKYTIHCPGFETVNASDWLFEELHHYRASQK